MASTINVLTTGVGGVQTTGDTSGILQMQTNGTATLTIDTAGKVGIGTTSPNTKLHVLATGTGNCIRVESASGPNIAFAGTEVSGKTYLIGEGLVTAGNFSIYDNNIATERFIVGTNGEIGVSGGSFGTSGQFLKSNGPGAAATWGTAGGGFSNMTVFTSPGTFTTPATVTQIKVTVVGGGGGGGQGGQGGTGGGGGGAAIYVGSVTASTPYAVTVGTGGAVNGAGGTSSFAALASATGGSTGNAAPSSAGVVGGTGGAGSAGTLQFKGSGGGSWTYPLVGSAGGSSYLGGGGIGGAAPSSNGGNYGGGGGGSGPGGPGTFTAGLGAAGVVIVEY